ncbi:MAG: ATP-binding protein [Clostridia bacterium]
MEQEITGTKEIEEFSSKNEPNAGILIYALQHLGYENDVAICDIIDNSIDAEATKVKLILEKDRIIIADNGSGMNYRILDQALKFGSEVVREDNTCLGKFGMGLSTASISIGNRTTVITKQKKFNIFLKSSVDVNVVKAKNEFLKYIGEGNKDDIELFEKYVQDESGTIVIIEDCVGIKNKNMNQFANKMKTVIARIYRKFMSKIDFYVNDTKILMDDPLWLEDKETEVYSDENYEIKWKDKKGNERTSTINAKLVLLPLFPKDEARKLKINIPNQGFSILRNSREIAFGYMPKWITKHNKYNRFRGEISFLSEMDEAMGVGFTKNGIDMMDSINDILQQYLKAQIIRIGNNADQQSVKIVNSDISHEDAERGIENKSNVLIMPKEEGSEYSYEENGEKGEEENLNNKKVRVKFITVSAGRSGNIFSAYLKGKTTVIEWNIDHPFYDKFVVSNKDNASLVSAIDYLIYSIASSQLKVLGEDNEKAEIIDQLISIMSNNMRSLLS